MGFEVPYHPTHPCFIPFFRSANHHRRCCARKEKSISPGIFTWCFNKKAEICGWITINYIHYSRLKSLAIEKNSHPNPIPIFPVTSRWVRLFEMIQKQREYYIPPYPTFCSNFSRGTSGIHAEPWAKWPSLCCALVLLQRARPALWTRCLA